MAPATLTPYHVSPNSWMYRSIWFMGGLLTVHADAAETNGQFALIEISGGPGGEPPLHVHQREDELFYVVEGRLMVICGGQTRTLDAGDSAFLPRHIPHTFKIVSKQVRFLVYVTPAGFEEYFRELGEPAKAMTVPGQCPPPDFEKIARVAARHGLSFV